MSFESILRKILDECPDGLGVALMGRDGIPLAQVQASTGGRLGEDIAVAGVEFGRILGEIVKASDALRGGSVVENVVILTRFALILRVVDEDFFVVLALPPDGNLGKARYLIRRHLVAIRHEL